MKKESKISAEYLFHFTNKIENLLSILNNYFMPFYCLERLSYLNLRDDSEEYFELAFPLVCFCDIPNPLQDRHREKFGGYGIGLDKSWGIKNGLTPIVYTHKNSIISSNLKYFIELYIELQDKLPYNKLQGLNNQISYLMMHYKAYEGYSYKIKEKQFDQEITRFYDEREWRYLPLNCDGLKLSMVRKDFECSEKLKIENKNIQACNKLKFQLSDIKFLYLKNKVEIQPFLDNLSNKYSCDEINKIMELITITQ